jgi:hypothetical protein
VLFLFLARHNQIADMIIKKREQEFPQHPGAVASLLRAKPYALCSFFDVFIITLYISILRNSHAFPPAPLILL